MWLIEIRASSGLIGFVAGPAASESIVRECRARSQALRIANLRVRVEERAAPVVLGESLEAHGVVASMVLVRVRDIKNGIASGYLQRGVKRPISVQHSAISIESLRAGEGDVLIKRG